MIKKEYPEEAELVVGTITKVQNFGAFVSLDEYPNKEGFIHISEIATGWVKRIRNFVREKQKVVCKVVHVDEAKKHIDLSLKKVNDHQRREKIQDWKNAQKATRLFEMVAQELGKSVDQCYKEFGDALLKKYGTMYAAFEESAYDANTLKNDSFSGDWLKKFEEVAKGSITVPFVEIKGMLLLTSFLPDGITHIKEALNIAEKSEFDDVTIDIKYIGAPRYMVKVKAPDYKIAESQMKKAVERAEAYMKKMKGECEFQREVEE
ncbi:MAG: translation initiation factor IF-2 subunit alpha [Euryarchaeota archaeon]|jgi:translation initiation factor 2 subunit 1|nr:translation initiation factor IF-2 subunit alpha [Euryarchaeota archaeon]